MIKAILYIMNVVKEDRDAVENVNTTKIIKHGIC